VKIDGNLFVSERPTGPAYHACLMRSAKSSKAKTRLAHQAGHRPAYGDKAARTGIRVLDLVNPLRFKQLLKSKIKENNEVLKPLGPNLCLRKVHAEYRAAGDQIRPFVTNTVVLLHEAMRKARTSS